MSKINFKDAIIKIGSWTLIKLPKSASAPLPSRGMTMVQGTINGIPFQTPLEPDGKGSHWFKIDKSLQKSAGIAAGDTVTVEIEPTKEWPDPVVPPDLKKALVSSPPEHRIWVSLTPMARWDWIRWINATKNPATRQKRIENTIGKLNSGKRRPCCFNRSQCTEPDVSHNGMLIDPTQHL